MTATHINKFHPIEHTMRQGSNVLIDSKSPQNWPALRIQTIAAHFFPRKFFAFDQNRPQSCRSTKCGANRPCGPAADDRDIKNFHIIQDGAVANANPARTCRL